MDGQALSIVVAIVTGLLTIILAGVGWWVKNIWAMVMAQQQQITELNIELAKVYVPRAEVEKSLSAIFSELHELTKTVATLAARFGS